MSELLDRLQSATEGSRQLEYEMAKALGWRKDQTDLQGRVKWLAPGASHTQYLPEWTRNLQDAVSLVLEGALWRIGHSGDHKPGIFLAVIMPNVGAPFEATATTPAFALCIAIIKAHESKEAAAA